MYSQKKHSYISLLSQKCFDPASIYMFKVNNKNSGQGREYA